MLKRPITYEDAEGVTHTKDFYFNLAKFEIMRLEVHFKGGLEAGLKRIIEADDSEALLREWEYIILMAYGEKTEDGQGFDKSPEVKNRFEQSFAYQALAWELTTDSKAAAEFTIGVMPREAQEEARKEMLKGQVGEAMGTTPTTPAPAGEPTTAEIAAGLAAQNAPTPEATNG